MRPRLSLIEKQNLKGIVFIIPWLVGFFLFFMNPLYETFIYSLSEVNIAGGVSTVFKGISNYQYIFTSDAIFLPTLTSTIISMLVNTPMILVFSLLAATLINREFKGRWFVRMVFFLPIIYGTGVLQSVQQNDNMYLIMLNRMGAVRSESMSGALLEGMDITGMYYSIANYLGEANVLIHYVIGAANQIFSIINRSGIQILIFLAALRAVPKHLYEAARVEGATGIDSFWKITLPLLLPHILTVTIFTVIDSFVNAENKIIGLMQNTMFSNQDLGYGSALSMLYFLTIVILIGIVAFTINFATLKKGDR